MKVCLLKCSLRKVYFQIALLNGGNLGLNQMLAFTDSFTHGKPCRICSARSELIKSSTKEVKDLLRNENTFNLDCAKKNRVKLI